MKIYSYKIDHDYGLAPNPFGNYCTIAVCKPEIRKSKNLDIGDWLIGTGSKSLEKATGFECDTKLIYAMKVTEIIDLNSYWHDTRFEYKKPIMNGTLTTMFGDNFYFLDNNEKWVQLDCAHRNPDGVYDDEHFRKDTGGENALISEEFYYFGDSAPQIPNELIDVCHSTQGSKIVKPDELAVKFIAWLEKNFERGMLGMPVSWIKYYI